VVQYDRRTREIIDADGVREKFGVGPASIPDYLGLVGDTADGFPGLPGWGAKSTSLVLARYEHLENIPPEASLWEVDGLRGAAKLSKTLQDQMELAVLFRVIATVDRDVPVGTVDDWRWTGPTDAFPDVCERLGVPALANRASALTP
jgi:5'-3' exonuclease